MSLYDKASLALIPSGYKAGSTVNNLYSVLPANGDGDFNATRSSSATRVNKDGLIESVVANTPRLNYPLIDGVVQSCPELLLEPLSKNEIADSEDFSVSGWIKSSATVTLDSSAIAPDGSAGVYQFAPDTATNNHQLRMDSLVLSGGTVVFSVFAKAGTERYVRLRMGNTTDNPRVWFDLQTGVVENEDVSGSGSIENYGNGWYRLIVTNTANVITSTTGQAQIFIQSASSASTIQTTYTGDPNQHIYVWGAQWENLDYVSSYIPTSGSTVTRNADECNGAGTSAEFNDSEGALFVEANKLANDSRRSRVAISDGSSSNRIIIDFSNTDNQLEYYVIGGDYTSGTHSVDLLSSVKACVKYKVNDVALWVNGFEVRTATPATLPSGFSELAFDAGDGANDFYGKTKQLMTFNEALTDSELEQITSWTSFGEMAKGQLYTIE